MKVIWVTNNFIYNLVLASPFKTKLESEPINSTDIKNLMEQSNYTNKYLQALGKNLGTSQINQASHPLLT